jgi:hypothetical protein
MIDFLYDPINGNCVAWILDGDVFGRQRPPDRHD